MVNLVKLDLSNNQLTLLPDSFGRAVLVETGVGNHGIRHHWRL
jgi:hypothetical protein